MKTMNSTQKYHVLLFMLIFFNCKANAQSQFYLSEVWDGLGGEMAMFYRNASTTDDLRNVYVVGENIGFGTNTLNTITVKATYYFVKTNQSTNSIVNKWLPECGTSNPNQLIPFSFSLHIRENNELSTPENQLNHLHLFPNPADNSITLKLTNQPIKRVSIYDLQGRIVYWHELENSSNRSDIDVGIFNSGLYVVQVESIDGIVSSSKFIKK
jgi:hypothetical protein